MEEISNQSIVRDNDLLNSEDKERIRESIPLILEMNKKLTVDEFCAFLNSTRKSYITKRLFTILEEKLHALTNEEDVEQINKIAYYCNIFSKLKAVGPVYLYRKAKISGNILDGQRKYFKKHNYKIYRALDKVFNILNIIKADAITVTKDHYKFLMKFIYDIRDIKDIKELIAKYPDFVNIKDDSGTPIICKLIDAFIKAIISKKISNGLYLLTYYQAVIEVFLNSESLIVNEELKTLIENRLKEATRKVEKLDDKQKLLWIKSLCSTLLGEAPITKEEVLTKYNVYVHLPADEKANYKLSHEGRRIITNQKIITIDASYSEDLDDALNLQVIDNKYHLNGYISDVASIIKSGSRLDSIARRKNVTSYWKNPIDPLFPFVISEDICSLKPGKLKNVIGFHLILNKNGIVEEDIEIYPAVINVDRRLSHEDANRILLSGDPDYELTKMLNQMGELTANLRSSSNRLNWGFYDSLDLGVHFGERSTNAHKIIEEFMILINSYTAAKFSVLRDVPFVFRVHKMEKSEDIAKIKAVIDNMYKSDYETINEIMRILSRIMDNAKYSIVNTGHEALNLDYYSHVTSPIRRYCDLVIQRIMHDFLFNKVTLAKVKYYEQYLEKIVQGINENYFVNKQLEKEYVRSKILIP